VELYVEIRGRRAFLYTEVLKGPGGLPLGSRGKVLALVSSGIDSPVAAWMMMRRGAHVDVFYLQSRRDTCLKLGIKAYSIRLWRAPHKLSKGTPHHENRLVVMYKNCVC
jgi:adenylyl- and sulfurtransferase ThiI